MVTVPVSTSFRSPAASVHALRWSPAPTAAFASGSLKLSPACAGRCGRPKAAPRPGREAETAPPEAVIVDSWLPDLDLAEFLKDFRSHFPDVDLVTASGTVAQESPRGPYRQELLYALRRSQDTDTAIWNAAPALNKPSQPVDSEHVSPWPIAASAATAAAGLSCRKAFRRLQSDLGSISPHPAPIATAAHAAARRYRPAANGCRS